MKRKKETYGRRFKREIDKSKIRATELIKPIVSYDLEEDILFISFKGAKDYSYSVECEEGIVFDFSKDDSTIGIQVENFREKMLRK